MGWFGISRDDSSDDEDESDTGSQSHEPYRDLEAGQDDGETSTMPFLDPASSLASSVNNPTTSSSSSSRRSRTPSDDADSKVVSFRPLMGRDRTRIQQLHENWFPVRYSDEFYTELVNNHRLATSGDKLVTFVATLNNNSHDERNVYCQEAGQASLPEVRVEQDEIIGCVVGSFLHRSRLSPETANLLLPNPDRHSRMFYIMTLGTVDQYRNFGVATSLVEQCMQLVEDDPACGVLYLHVIPFNHAAINFYEKLGFYRVCTIADYYNIDNKHYDCYLYAKYYHGNRGHRTLYKLVTGAISSIWNHIKAPLSGLVDFSNDR